MYPKQANFGYATNNIGTPITSLNDLLSTFCNVDVLKKYLDEKPDCLHERGFNGMYPLHKAVLNAPLGVIELLLQRNANPNAANDFNETPVHFSCRLQSAQILHLLIKYGGDITLVDNSGRGCVMNCVASGSRNNLFYLRTIHDVNFLEIDNQGCNPLHYACGHAHNDIAIYFLDLKIFDIFQKDAQGNSILHIAAWSGNHLLCWKFLEHSGLLLYETNNDGHTALDLAQKGQHNMHKKVAETLQEYQRKKSCFHKFMNNPNIIWYRCLFSPAIIYFISSVLGNIYSYYGLVMFIGLMTTAYMVTKSGHRIRHHSGLPNPIFVGFFLGGLVMTTWVYLHNILPILFEENIAMHILCLMSLCTMHFLYYKLMTGNPGFQAISALKEDGEHYTMIDLITHPKFNDYFCSICEIVREPYTKHCRICNNCVNLMDHHCLILYKCVAKINHVLFIRFIILCTFNMILFEYFCYRYIAYLYELKISTWILTTEILENQCWLWSMMLGNAGSIIWAIILLQSQFRVIGKKSTSYFQLSMYTKFTSVQQIKNVLNFVVFNKNIVNNTLYHNLR